MAKTKSKRIFYFDALRALAIICVILIHAYAVMRLYIISDYATTFRWFFTQFVGNTFRIGVDLFLILSGALSLGRVWDIRSFLGKRIPRIVAPFVFWGLVLSILLILISYYTPYKYIEVFTLSSILNYIWNSYLSLNTAFGPYWFFWMILGTYLIMPIINKWILHSELTELEYFLVFWLITCLFTYTLNTPFPIKLDYFASPIGLVVLGYYLRYTERKPLNNPWFGLLLILGTIVVSMFFAVKLSSPTKYFYFDRYSIMAAIEVIGVFIVFKNFSKFNINFNFLTNPDGIFRKLVFALAKYSYGIYLIHSFVLYITYRVLFHNNGNYTLWFIFFVLVDIFGSLAIMALLNRVPYINQVIGAK